MLQGFGSLLYVLLCPYLISLIIDGMKMVKSNGYKSFPDGITELLMFDDINHSENTLEDYGSDIETNSEEDKSGDQIQKCFPNMCCKCISLWKDDEFLQNNLNFNYIMILTIFLG